MPNSTINATTNGLNSTAGNVATLDLQVAGSTVASATSGGVAITGTLSASGATTLSGAVSASSLSVNSNNISADNSLGFRNRIINGGMQIDQRNAGASSTPASGTYTLDRFVYFSSQASKFTVQQNAGSVTPPSSFSNYLGFTVASAVSIGSDDTFQLQQRIEGFNFADMNWGTASAKTITLSFWVRSSLTGTFGGALRNSGDTRSYAFTYSISAANTWTNISITISGDTTGTWIGATNGIGVKVIFGLGCGSNVSGTAGSWANAAYDSATGAVSVVGTASATWYITGVQLEVGSTATPFERRPYGTELALCQRYYYKIQGSGTGYTMLGWGWNTSTTESRVNTSFKVPMRIRPTALEQSGTASHYDINHSITTTNCSAVPAYRAGTSSEIGSTAFTVSSGLTDGQGSAGASANNNTSAYLAWSAEL